MTLTQQASGLENFEVIAPTSRSESTISPPKHSPLEFAEFNPVACELKDLARLFCGNVRDRIFLPHTHKNRF
jgi:hypothetical protein